MCQEGSASTSRHKNELQPKSITIQGQVHTSLNHTIPYQKWKEYDSQTFQSNSYIDHEAALLLLL